MSKNSVEDGIRKSYLKLYYSEARWYSKDSKSNPQRELQKSWRFRKWCYAHVCQYTTIQHWRILGKSQTRVPKNISKIIFLDFRRQCYSSICFHISKTNVTKKWPASKCYNNKKLRVLELSSVHIALYCHHSLVTGSGSISLKLKNRDHPESSNDGHSEVKKKKKKKKKKQSSDEDDDSDYSE